MGVDAEHAGSDFDEEFYLQKYPDVARTIGPNGWPSGLKHFLTHGKSEGRLGAPSTDLEMIRLEAQLHRGAGYLAPVALRVSHPSPVKIAMIGSCLIRAWGLEKIENEIERIDLYVVNFLSLLPQKSPEQVLEYDFAVIQLPLRSILSDSLLWHLDYEDTAVFSRAFEKCSEQLERQLANWMCWNRDHGLLTFVCNFLTPQANLMGRLFPRYDLRNPQYFVECLNERLEQVVRKNPNAYLFDIDKISSSFGRRFVQDDSISLVSHNSVLGYGGARASRLEPTHEIQQYYESNWPETFRPAIWAELSSMYRTVRQIDTVKLVVFDLDDTLWQGVSGDMSEIDPGTMTEGWPLGVAEAAAYLKKRGILLAIISKNEERRIKEIFPQIWGNRLHLEDFAAVTVNWRSKAENMAEMLSTMNLLPRNVVFIDDNPVERSAMQAAFPDMRILGRHPYYLRRILLWSSETEVVSVTAESGRRTEMVQKQFERETQRKSLSREDFLAAAEVRVEIFEIKSVKNSRFPRVLELINKTNQYNTTGRRWKAEELNALIASKGRIFAFNVTDKFTNYGLVGAILVEANYITQWVMSCRILGYDIEQAVMETIISAIQQRSPGAISGYLIETDVNFPCRSLFLSCGFVQREDEWHRPDGITLSPPSHVEVKFHMA